MEIKEPDFPEVIIDTTTSYNESAERATLGAVMRGGRTAYEKAAEILTGQDFYVHRFRFIWDAFASLAEQGLSIDTISAGDELARAGKLEEIGGRNFLADLRTEGDPRNIETYAANVQDYSVKRDILRIASEGAAASLNGKRAADIMGDMTRRLAGLSIHQQDENTVDIAAAVVEAYEWTDRASRGEIPGVKTGFVDLDKILGSLIAGNFYIVAGRPGTGKTALMVTIAYRAAKEGKRVAFFSLEMSRLQIAQRFIAIESGIDLHRIIKGEIQEHEWPILAHANEAVSALPITINDWSGVNISGIRRIARRINAANKIDLLIVDYLQLMDGEGKKNNRQEEVSAISRGLKNLAGELKVPLLAGAQLNRNLEARADKRPQLSDLRESGSLEQDAYAVMFLYRDDDPQKANITELAVAKHRNGPTGRADLLFRAPIAKFESVTSRTVQLNDPAPHWAGDD